MSVLVASLGGDGATVELSGVDTPSALRSSLGRNIAPGNYTRPSAGVVSVPLGAFLARRAWLGGQLKAFGCGFAPDRAIEALLARETREASELSELLKQGAAASNAGVPESELVAAGLKRVLKPFQARDLARLLALSHGANFSVPGAGKTTVTYALHALERSRGRVNRLLVVAPLSAFGAWEEESIQCFESPLSVARLDEIGSSLADVRLVNYQRLASRYDELARWLLAEPTQVILDEAHRMKRGNKGEWGRVCLDLAHLAARRDILTGTPAPQHPRDFVALVDFLWPQQSPKVIPRTVLRQEPSADAMSRVSANLAPLFVRTNKAELKLAKPKQRVELVSMGPLQAEIYEALRTRLRYSTSATVAEQTRWGDMGGVVMYLLEAASNPALLSQAVAGSDGSSLVWPSLEIPRESSLAEKVLNYASFEVPAKFQKLAAMVEANVAKKRKTLVWSNFVGNLRSLADTVLAPYHPAVVYGAVPAFSDDENVASRDKELHRFRTRDDCAVLLANPQAMSEGVSLHHECHDAIYVDRTFNAGQYLQSIDRIHRLGLRKGTTTRITFLACKDTIDEQVDLRVKVKAERLALMLSDPSLVSMSLPDEDAYGEWVEPGDLAILLAHLNDG